MRSEARFVARHIHRVPNTQPRTLFDVVAVLVGLVGVALFGIGLVQVWGGIWCAFGFVGCVAAVAVSGFDLAPSTRGSTTGGHSRA